MGNTGGRQSLSLFQRLRSNNVELLHCSPTSANGCSVSAIEKK